LGLIVALNERFNHAYKTYASRISIFILLIYALRGVRVSNVFDSTLWS